MIISNVNLRCLMFSDSSFKNNISFLPIFLQYLEEEENIKNTINNNLFLNEINVIRKKYNITKRYEEQVMNEYRSLLNK